MVSETLSVTQGNYQHTCTYMYILLPNHRYLYCIYHGMISFVKNIVFQSLSTKIPCNRDFQTWHSLGSLIQNMDSCCASFLGLGNGPLSRLYHFSPLQQFGRHTDNSGFDHLEHGMLRTHHILHCRTVSSDWKHSIHEGNLVRFESSKQVGERCHQNQGSKQLTSLRKSLKPIRCINLPSPPIFLLIRDLLTCQTAWK